SQRGNRLHEGGSLLAQDAPVAGGHHPAAARRTRYPRPPAGPIPDATVMNQAGRTVLGYVNTRHPPAPETPAGRCPAPEGPRTQPLGHPKPSSHLPRRTT
ncbi:MAG: hypothetical protein WHU94_14095, partial [Thermogemmata sp.]